LFAEWVRRPERSVTGWYSAAVDVQGLSGDVAGAARRQKVCRLGDLARPDCVVSVVRLARRIIHTFHGRAHLSISSDHIDSSPYQF
jgi:hypothetical protein